MAEAGLEFGILGPLQVIADGTALHVGGPKPRALLALLLIHANETVSAERLIDDLWDAQPPRSATATLQTYVSQLRKHVGTSTLLTTPNGYRLDVPRTHLDGARFEATLHEAAHAHERNAALVAERLCDALQLWRGTALADFVGASWANGEAARLNGLRLVAIEARIDARLTLAEHTRLVPELEALIEVHTLRERLWGQLMLALYRCGRQADALRVCSRLRMLLKEELGIEPTRDISRLEHAILLHDADLDLPTPNHSALIREPSEQEATARPRPPSRHNLPQEVSSFVGRQRDLAELQGLVESARLVTLTGPGGSGKTRLALAAASRLVDNYDDGIWFVDLAAISAPDEVVSAAASTLGVRAEHGRALADALVEWLSERQLLLVLDNCEHVVDGAAKLCDSILRYCPTVRVFATSREGLMVGGEHIQQVAPLSLPPADCVDAATARRAEAVELFVDRAVTHDTRFSLDDHCAEVVAATCRRLDGIPLAIELAAARLRHLGIHDLAHLLDERFRLLNVGPRTAPRRQQTLTAMVQWSYDLLTAPERRVFERLSLFAGPWTVDAATRVCADAEIDHWEVLDHIGGLVDKSLVVVGRAGEQVRYRLLETLRAYAADRLRERSSAEQIRACDGFVEHFVGLARRVDANGHDQSAGAWFALLDDSRANLHAALARCSTTARYRARGCELAGAMADYWQVRGETELRDQLSALVDNADTASAGVRARALLALAEMLYVCRDVASAEARLAQALPLSTEAQDAALECKILDGLAHACWEQGDPDGARQRLDEAEVVARDAGDPHGVLLVRQNRAYIEAALGDPAASKRLLLENLSDARELGEPRLLMMSLLNLGWDDFGLGAHESARAYLAEAIAIAGSIGADPRRLQMYAILAMVAVVELDGEEAGRNLAVALDAPIATLAGNIDLLHDCLRACLLTLHLLGDDRAAMRLCGALDRFVSQNKLIIEPLEQTLDARVRTSLEQRLGADVVELEKAAGRSNTVPESLALARAALQNRQRVEPGVSSAVPTAVAVRGLTS